jgi:hypothetical protein
VLLAYAICLAEQSNVAAEELVVHETPPSISLPPGSMLCTECVTERQREVHR